jgi:hypothetical protein
MSFINSSFSSFMGIFPIKKVKKYPLFVIYQQGGFYNNPMLVITVNPVVCRRNMQLNERTFLEGPHYYLILKAFTMNNVTGSTLLKN